MKISVALCTYNGQKYLEEQLQSILHQSTPVSEIIICDDCSTDETHKILERFEKMYPGLFSLYFNGKTVGVIKNFEQALALCDGDIIFLSDQDDTWVPNKVEKCIEFFKHNPEMYGVVTDAEMVDDAGGSLNKTLFEMLGLPNQRKRMGATEFFGFMLLYGNIMSGNCLVIRKPALDIIFPFKYIEGVWHDEWIAMKLAEQNKIRFLDEPLTRYRMHEGQQTKWLWLDRNEKNRKRNSFMCKQTDLYPLDYYKHWKRRTAAIEALRRNGFSVDDKFYKEILDERKKGLLVYLKNAPLLKKKRKLFKLWLDGEENISFWNLVKE